MKEIINPFMSCATTGLMLDRSSAGMIDPMLMKLEYDNVMNKNDRLLTELDSMQAILLEKDAELAASKEREKSLQERIDELEQLEAKWVEVTNTFVDGTEPKGADQ